MSDMLKDGASGGAGRLPPSESHDEFVELCATATTGSLNAEERRRLNEHLSRCASCREVMAQYLAIADRVIPALSPTPAHEGHAASEWSQDLAERELLARLNEGNSDLVEEPERLKILPESASNLKSPASEEALWSHMWIQFAAAVMLVAALGLMAYRMGKRKGTEIATKTSALPISKPPTSEVGAIGQAPSSPGSGVREQAEDRMEALQSQLREKLAEIDHLKAQEVKIQKQMNLQTADLAKLAQDRATLSQQLEVAQRDLGTAEQKLGAATRQSSEDIARNIGLQQKIEELNTSLTDRDEEIARERALLDHDRDIRELMGSRDLYVAEVYDVAKTGDTQKPFGRVFYTRAKSLIFYAYDLDQQKGVERASTFQAWGRIGPNRDRAVNLGILFQDNANKKRWVLKSNNPKTLAQIDAVFVTVEPNGGSAHPSGKPLLFAYLKIQPNHP